jgi:hypothetical protein
MTAKRYLILVISLLVLLVTIFFGPFAWVYLNSTFFGRQEILNTARAIASKESSQEKILDLIADWLKEHMTYDTKSSYFYPVPPFLLWRMSSPDPAWVMTIKRGGCEEYAILFTEMARSVGIESRVVHNPSEDHVWSEVFINGSWTHFDPTLSKGNRFNNPGLYERSREKGGWGKQLSYVFFIDNNGTQQDITERYTSTGRLIIKVEKDNAPVENAKVIVKSRFLMENSPSYRVPLFVSEKYTNATGLCSFDLGGNNFTVIAQLGTVFGYKDETIVHLNENDSVSATLRLSELSLLLSSEDILMISFVTSASALLITEFVVIYKKLRTKSKQSTRKI